MSLHPDLVWAQRKDRLLITIKVKECTGADVRFFAEGRISFKGCGVGGKEYGIELDLLEGIDPGSSTHECKVHGVELVVMKKAAGDYWPRLTSDTGKNHKILPDWDRFIEQDEEDEKERVESLKKMKAELEDATREEDRMEDEFGALMITAYQLLFHVIYACAWLYVIVFGTHAVLSGPEHVWPAVGTVACILPFGGWIELLNIGTGVVQGSLSHTVVQVFDRIVLAGALFMLPGLRTSASVPIIFLSWAIADLLRHVFYGVTLLYFVIDMPGTLKWARYSVCPLLYTASLCAQLPIWWSTTTTMMADQSVGIYQQGALAVYACCMLGPWGAPRVLMYMHRMRKRKLNLTARLGKGGQKTKAP